MTHWLIFTVSPSQNFHHGTMDVRNNSVGVCNIALKLGNNCIGVYNTLTNTRNNGVGVHDITVNIGNN